MVSTTVTIGDKPREAGGPNWRISVSNPRAEGDNLGLFTLQGDFYLSTSGDYQRFFMYGGVRYHHIFDPSTGRPATGTISDSVLILSPRELGGAETDILSTALFVMGYPRAIDWAGNMDTSWRWLTRRGTSKPPPAWPTTSSFTPTKSTPDPKVAQSGGDA